MKNIKFIVEIVPTAQRRVRHGVVNRGKQSFTTAYKDKIQKINEQELEYLILKHRPKEKLSGPLFLNFTAYLPVPKTLSKKDKELLNQNKLFPVKKPDVDNLTKQLLDCMTRLSFWNDDCQVVEISSKKMYDTIPRWEIELGEL